VSSRFEIFEVFGSKLRLSLGRTVFCDFTGCANLVLVCFANGAKSPFGVLLLTTFNGGDEIGGTTPFASCAAGTGTAFAGTVIAATRVRAPRTAMKPRAKDRAKVPTKYQP